MCVKMEGKTNFSRHLKQFDGLTGLNPTPIFYHRSTAFPPPAGSYHFNHWRGPSPLGFGCIGLSTKADIRFVSVQFFPK